MSALPIRFWFVTAEHECLKCTIKAPIVCVTALETGYHPIQTHQNVRDMVDGLNKGMPDNVLRSALEASIFGWHTPAAREARNYIDEVGVVRMAGV